MAKKRKKTPQVPYKFRGLVLDDFQTQAVWHLQRKTSLLICAPTGTGKTLIADFLVDMALKEDKNVIFTAPIKALVNQKYREFSKQFGQRNVGIVTGDVSQNKDASLVVMTTEVFRNMLLKGEPHPDIEWVVFDEIHYLDHPERGTVWEEAIMLLPKSIGVLGLSATIPNAAEIADWIEAVHRPISVITHTERAVPLVHLYFNESTQAVARDELLGSLLPDRYDPKGGTMQSEDFHFRGAGGRSDSTGHLDLISYVIRNRLLPCLYFVFSRRGCEEKARELASTVNLLKPQEKRAIEVTVRNTLKERGIDPEDIPNLSELQHQWYRGIGVHHAGLLPVVKEIVESLLSRRLLRILYVTETFAVGVNMPVRTVCFDSLKKHDGTRRRLLTQQEYFQMAGRAGRRGQDKQGTVLSRIDFSDLRNDLPPKWEETRLEPVTSKVSLSFNTVVNLLAKFSREEIVSFFERTLANYQHKRLDVDSKNRHNTTPAQVLYRDFEEKAKLLEKLEFITDGRLTEKGETCRGIFVQEVLITELLYQGAFEQLALEDIAAMLASLLQERRLNLDSKQARPQKWIPLVAIAVDRLKRFDQTGQLGGASIDPSIGDVMSDWIRGTRLRNLMKRHSVSEGDFVNTCRRTIDLARQIRAVFPGQVSEKMESLIERLDRDVVRVHL